MSKHRHQTSNDVNTLAADARALMDATADMAGVKVEDARKRLTAALERAQEIAGDIRDKAVAGAKATDEAVRENPYATAGIAFGLGAILGYLVSRRGCSPNGD